MVATNWPRKSRSRRGGSSSRSSPTCSSFCCSLPRRSRPALWLYERESALPYEAIAILAVVLLNADHGLCSGIARRSGGGGACAQMSAAHATVIRDGERRSVPAAELVPGDLILIEEGDTDSRRRARDSIHRAANGRSGADRREPAGLERHRADRRRSRARRPPQHDLQRHRGDLRARQSGRHGDRHADRDGPHRRNARRGAREKRRRCKRNSTASANCSA